MERSRALDILVANAICSSDKFTCDDCPLCVENEKMNLCNVLNDKNLHKAIEVFKRK